MKSGRIILFVLIGYTLLLCYWMFFSFGRKPGSVYQYNLIPFLTIYHFFTDNGIKTKDFIINIFGNIGVFIPFGILLPQLFGMKYKNVALIFVSALTILEFMQLISKRGTFDIDDIILNLIGFSIGYLCLKYAKSRIRPLT